MNGFKIDILTELIHHLWAAKDANAMWQYQTQFLSRHFGLDGAMLVYSPKGFSTAPQNSYHLSTYPSTFIEEYLAVGGLQHDITIFIASLIYKKLFRWEDTETVLTQYPQSITPQVLDIEELSCDFGVNYGFSLALDSHVRSKAGIGLSALGIQKNEFHRDILPLQDSIFQSCKIFQLAMTRFPKSGNKGFFELDGITEREKDILMWLASGLRLQEIADDKIYRSIHTLNKDIKKLKGKLHASTIEELVATGLLLNIID